MVRLANDGGPPEFGGRPPSGLRRASESRLRYVLPRMAGLRNSEAGLGRASESRLWYAFAKDGGPPAFGGRPPSGLRRASESRLWYVLPRMAGFWNSEAGLRRASESRLWYFRHSA